MGCIQNAVHVAAYVVMTTLDKVNETWKLDTSVTGTAYIAACGKMIL